MYYIYICIMYVIYVLYIYIYFFFFFYIGLTFVLYHTFRTLSYKYYFITLMNYNGLIISNIEKEKAAREKYAKACVTPREKGECGSSDGRWAMNLTGSRSGWIFSEYGDYSPHDFWNATDHLAIPQTNTCEFFDQIRLNFFLFCQTSF